MELASRKSKSIIIGGKYYVLLLQNFATDKVIRYQ